MQGNCYCTHVMSITMTTTPLEHREQQLTVDPLCFRFSSQDTAEFICRSSIVVKSRAYDVDVGSVDFNSDGSVQ